MNNQTKFQDKLIDLKNITKTYETEAGDFLALKNINLTVYPGEFVAVIGKSGSGKSTLINMISGIDRPSSGEIIINQTPVHKLNENEMAIWRGKNQGIVFQFFQLLGNLTVLENIMLPMDFCNVYESSERENKAMELLDLVALKHHAHKLPSQLSGGQQQRIAIARALANDPPIILADEPTGNLDSRTANHIFEIFSNLIKKGKTILMVTHDNEMAKRAQRTIIISDGEIVEEHLRHVFPSLDQKQLVWVTSQLKVKKYPPGAFILKEGEPQNRFFVVVKGKVDIILKIPGKQEMVVAQYGPREYFGEVELVHRQSTSTASARASLTEGAEVAELNQSAFNKLISQSKSIKKRFENEASKRLAQNKALRKGKK